MSGAVQMAKYCPLTDESVIYLECLECHDEMCRRNYERERFYLFVGGSHFDSDVTNLALAGKRRNRRQIIIVSSLKEAKYYARANSFLFREASSPIHDCMLLGRKPDSGALILVWNEADEKLAERIRETGIRTHVSMMRKKG